MSCANVTLETRIGRRTVITAWAFIWFPSGVLPNMTFHVWVVQRVVETRIAAVAERQIWPGYLGTSFAMIHNARFFVQDDGLTMNAREYVCEERKIQNLGERTGQNLNENDYSKSKSSFRMLYLFLVLPLSEK
jgi:hypothetical protein